MPVVTQYVDLDQGAYKRARGVLTGTDLLMCVLAQSQDVEHTRKLKYIFYDFTEVTEVRVSADALPKLVELTRGTAANAPGLSAAVATPNLALFGIARNWQAFSGSLGWRVQVFRESSEAVGWLVIELARKNSPASFSRIFRG